MCMRHGAYHFQLSSLTSIGTLTSETLMQPAAPTVENTASPAAHAMLSTHTSTWPWTLNRDGERVSIQPATLPVMCAGPNSSPASKPKSIMPVPQYWKYADATCLSNRLRRPSARMNHGVEPYASE